MSGPNAPAQNRMTPKQYGSDRIPQSATPPQRNPGSVRVMAANKLGVEPRNLTQAPGLPQASSTPRPQAPPVRAPATPKPTPERVPLPQPRPPDAGVALPERLAPFPSGVPLPQPRPTAAMVNDITPVGSTPPPPGQPKVTMGWGGAPIASPDQTPPTAQPEGLTGMVAKVLRDRLGMPDAGNKAAAAPMVRPPLPPPDAWSRVPLPGQTLPAVVAQANKAKDEERMTSTQQEPVPIPRPRPDGLNAVQLNVPAPSPPGKPPATVEVVAPPPSDFKGSQGTFGGYYKRPTDEEGKVKKQGPQKATKEKGSNFYYYDTLGVARGDNRAAANAMSKLQQRAIDEPKTITPAEDRLLAQSGKTEAFNLSMEPSAVEERFKGYQAGRSTSEDKGPPRFYDRMPGAGPPQQRLPVQEGPMPPGSAPPQIQTPPQQRGRVDPAEDLAKQAIDEAEADDEEK